MPQFDIDGVMNNKYLKIFVSFGTYATSFYVVDDMFSIGTESGFNAMYDGNMAEDAGRSLGGEAGAALVKGFQTLSQSQLKSVWQTLNTWNGSKKPSFSFSVVKVKIRKDDDIVSDCATISAKCMPAGTSSIGEITEDLKMDAPNNYNPIKREGLCTVEIGNWFSANKLCLMSADFDYSKEVTIDGSPLYIHGKLSFEPYRMINDIEFAEYFPQVADKIKANLARK